MLQEDTLNKVPRIVYLSATSGGGHDATARALRELVASRLGRLGKEAEQVVVDVYGRRGILSVLPWLAKIRAWLRPV